MNKIQIYTDGACKNNPGIGGWGVIIINQEKKIISLRGFDMYTTNNRMELTAAIQGLTYIQDASEILLYTDSIYLQKGITKWIHQWLRNRWENSNKKPVKNKDLWKKLYQLTQKHTVIWEWVKAHAGSLYNEQADQLANQAISTAKKNL